ncbi:MAG: ABC transporter ATP-binding protein [Lachnospiraceae bacterium]|nr:ABC transporter ATP-binding protein [Lachnospiraceae bacterium]
MSYIVLSDIRKDYGTGESCTHVLRGVNISFEEGSYTAIMGPSGSGKSTLLNILGGMDRMTSGSYRFQGEEVGDLSAAMLERFRKQNIAFVFQSFALMNRYTVYENVEMPLKARGIRNRKERVMNALQSVGIGALAEKKVNRLSGGEKQRTAMARAIAIDAPILLADEPTGALDRENGDLVMDIVDEIYKRGKTVIVITHDERVASRATKVLRIINGEIKDDYMNETV